MDISPTTRLRKTFHYPADDDAEDSMPEALDEEGLSPVFNYSIHPILSHLTHSSTFNFTYPSLPLIHVLIFLNPI
jgi:hypothetical protein